MFLGFIKFTSLGLMKIPYPHDKINNHYGLFYKSNNQIFGNILTSQKTPLDIKIKSYFIHLPNINGKNRAQYVWDRVYKFDNRLISIDQQTYMNQYLIDHHDKFQKVLNQINPTGNITDLIQSATDLTQFI